MFQKLAVLAHGEDFDIIEKVNEMKGMTKASIVQDMNITERLACE